jgi:TolA-binding protein
MCCGIYGKSRMLNQKPKRANKMKRPIILFLTACFLMSSCLSFAQDPKRAQELSQQISSARDNKETFLLFGKAKEEFVKDAKFNEFADFLKELSEKKKSLKPLAAYFLGACRYEQLKYLEEKQDWNEYFNKGNEFREELVSSLGEAIKSLPDKEAARLYSTLLLWQFHQDQQDAFAEESFNGLMSAVKSYSESAEDASALKDVADKLQSYDQKGKAKEIYRMFIEKAMKADLKEEQLKGMADGFFKAGNLELAETVYDVYLDKITNARDKKEVGAELIRLAREFSYKDAALCDVSYAEKLYEKLVGIAGKEAMDEQASYLRAYNLERSREFEKAKEKYLDLLGRFPNTAYYDKVNFKLGIFSVYALRDIKSGREFFQKLAGKETAGPEVISSLYQLGLLAQWEEDLERAKANYLKLKEKAGDEFKSSLGQAEQRLNEIAENKLLDNNIRSFLDVSLKDEYSAYNMSKVELKSSAYNLKKGQEFTMTATAYPPESGCMQVVLEYGWAGDPGKATPTSEESNFTSAYSEPGVKVIGLVVRSSGGILDRSIDLLDVD